MFFVLSKILDLALAPLTWCLLFALLALCKRPRSALYAAAGVVLLWASSVAPVAGRLQRTVEAGWKPVSPSEHFDAIVLLGGVLSTVSDEGTPGFNDNVERLHQSYEMLHSGAADSVVITGDFAGTPLSEAEILRDKLVLWGIAPARVVLEPKAKNTRENAVYTAPILREHGYAHVGLVTSRYHMRRAMGCFRAVGFELTPISVDTRYAGQGSDWSSWLSPRTHYLEMTTAALRELAGYWVYKARGWVS